MQRRHLVPLLLWLVPLPFALGLVPLVKFESEKIEVDVFPSHVNVDCEYNYRNPWPIPLAQGWIFPVPQDADHPRPQLVVAYCQPGGAGLPVFQSFGEFGMIAWFKPLSKNTVVARYVQQCPTHNARYILLSTKPWGQNLVHGIYTLHEHDTTITACNYPLKRATPKALSFERSDFMPDRDWTFAWTDTTAVSKN